VTRDDLAATLVQLRSRVDAHFAAAVARTPAAFACAEGCSACCEARFSVFPVEAAPIQAALARLAVADPALRARVRDQADDPAHQHHCALLVDRRCAVYAERPLICRSHGLPVVAPDTGAISHCPLNFTGDPTPPAASVLRLDAVNQPLAVIATLWDRARSPASSPRPSDRVALADLARASDPRQNPSPEPPATSPGPRDPAQKND
jgi:Fe-S-cluster containining protein